MRGYGHDGSNYDTVGAQIVMQIDGTPAANRMPTDIEFHTSAGAGDDDIALAVTITKDKNLVVVGDGTFQGNDIDDSGGNWIDSDGSGNTTLNGTLDVKGGVIEDTDAEDLIIRTNSNANQLVLDLGGNVGIGSASPDEALHVQGKIKVTEGIIRGFDTSILSLSGGTTNVLGGSIWLYGENHATFPSEIHFKEDNTVRMILKDGNLDIDGDLTVTGGNILSAVDIGNDTDDSSFAADGFLTFVGTARYTKHIVLSPANLAHPSSNPPDAVVVGNALVEAFDAATDQQLYATLELPREYNDGTDLKLHYHWSPSDANAGTVTWGVEWVMVETEANELLTKGTTTQIVLDDTQTLQDELLETGEITLDGTGMNAGDVVLLRLFRDADGSEGGADDDYASDSYLVLASVSLICDKVGEDRQW
jgi:hypothetical protein